MPPVHRAVLITGGTGFIGQSVVRRFLNAGWRVRVLARQTWPFPEHPLLERCAGDMRDEQSLRAAMEGAEGVVHLAATKSDETTSDAVNIDGAKHLASAAAAARVAWIVNMNTQSAKLRRRGTYGRTKAGADSALRAGPVPVTTLYGSLVYGEEPNGAFGGIVRFSRLPIVPVIGDGMTPFRPIHRDDLAEIFLRIAESDRHRGESFDAGGPEEFTFDQLLDVIQAWTSVRRPRIHLPIPVALLLARAMSFLPHPPLTVSNVLGAAERLPMDVQRTFDALDVHPRPLSEGLETMFPGRSPQHAEIRRLWRYVSRGARMPAGIPDVYVRALATHRLVPGDLAETRPLLLGALDAGTRLLRPHCILQKKLLIAAAVYEASPASAIALLPKKRSLMEIAGAVAASAIIAATKLFLFAILVLPLGRSFLDRHAGR